MATERCLLAASLRPASRRLSLTVRHGLAAILNGQDGHWTAVRRTGAAIETPEAQRGERRHRLVAKLPQLIGRHLAGIPPDLASALADFGAGVISAAAASPDHQNHTHLPITRP